MKRRIVIKDGRADNLYKVEEFSGKLVVHNVSGLFMTRETRIGSATSLADAIALVKAYAGSDKIDIKPW